MTIKIETCPGCGYAENDARFHMDHHLCKNSGNAPWEKRRQNASKSLPASPEDREEKAERYIRENGKKVHSNCCATSIAPAEEPGPCDCNEPQSEPVAPVEAQEKERCEFCLFFAPLHSSTCFHWDAEPKPTPSTPEPIDDDNCFCDANGTELCSLHRTTCIECGQKLPANLLGSELKPQPDSSSIPEEHKFRSDETLLRDILSYTRWRPGNHTKFDEAIREACIKLQGFDPDLDVQPRDSSSIIPEQTFEEWWDKSVQPDYFRDMRTIAKQAWHAAKGQSNGR